MLITQHLKLRIWQKLNQEQSTGSDQFSVVHVELGCYNGIVFWCLIDGETKTRQISLNIK